MVDDKSKLKSIINYGDGTYAHFKHIDQNVEVQEKGGKKYYNVFKLLPTLKNRLKHNIKDKDVGFIDKGDWSGFYEKRYLVDWCVILDASPDSQVWSITADYNGKYIDPFKGQHRLMMDKLNVVTKENEALRNAVASLTFELMQLGRNPAMYFKKLIGMGSEMLSNAPVVNVSKEGSDDGNKE